VKTGNIFNHDKTRSKIADEFLKLVEEKSGPFRLGLIGTNFTPKLARAASREN
jgi:hypothetical protein